MSVSVPFVDVVQPVQQGVDVGDLQLVVGDGLQATGDRLVVALHIHLVRVKGQDNEVSCNTKSSSVSGLHLTWKAWKSSG